MNIFVLDNNIEKCAIYHNNAHCVKMILEYTQLLSTAVRISGINQGYKITHINHPCSIWTRESLSNWRWLKTLLISLHEEWKFRYEHTKNHKSFLVSSNLSEPNIEDIGLTQFKLAMPDDCKENDSISAYRKYYIKYKQHLALWKKRDIPGWFKK